MDKKLKAYISEAQKLTKNPSKDTLEYHYRMLQHFQHERQIHLYVTLAFAFYMIIFFLAFLYISLNFGDFLFSLCFGIITVFLTITEVLYVRHYYLLENGVQKLQDLTREFYKK